MPVYKGVKFKPYAAKMEGKDRYFGCYHLTEFVDDRVLYHFEDYYVEVNGVLAEFATGQEAEEAATQAAMKSIDSIVGKE